MVYLLNLTSLDPGDVEGILKKKRLIKIINYGVKESLGFIEMYYNFNWLYTAVIKSDRCKMYKLELRVSIAIYCCLL